VWRWDNIDPFGNNSADENPNNVNGASPLTYNLRFPGQYKDRETGNHYNYFRDYNPGVGRYVQSDPIGLSGGLNVYVYADGDPVAMIDSDGAKSTRVAGQVSGRGYGSGNARQRRYDRRHKPPAPNTPTTTGQSALEAAEYFDESGEFVCIRWHCPTSPDSCSPYDTRPHTDFIPSADDPNKPPAGCVCDSPRYRLSGKPNLKDGKDVLEAHLRWRQRFGKP
jgi:RHS repeat-associated protein